jgi:hypothetical protein
MELEGGPLKHYTVTMSESIQCLGESGYHLRDEEGAYVMQTQSLELLFWVVISVGGIIAYMLPTILAVRLEHERAGLITFLNITLGWTIIGWGILLLWAINTDYLYGMMTRGRTLWR